jgi:hypothetical protein
MDREIFEDTLRRFIRHKPFFPFVVELITGEKILVEEPSVAFSDGFAGYFSPSYAITEFACDQVKDIRAAKPESAQ